MAAIQRVMSRLTLALSILLILGISGASAALTLSDPQRGPVDPNWQRIQAEGVMRVGFDPSIPPFGALDDQERPQGLDPSVARAIGQELGVDVRFVPLTFDGLYDALLLGQVDMVIAALRPDPLRRGRVRYTSPYFDAGQVFVSQEGIEHFSELENSRLAVEFASEGDLTARQHSSIELKRFFTAQEAIDAVIAGEVKAALVDRVSASEYLAQTEAGLQQSQQPIVPDPYVIAIRRSDWRFHQHVQQALLALDNNGSLRELYAEWL